MSGRLLDAFRIVPRNLWRHLGAQFNVGAPDLASLRALYRRGNTRFEHQGFACQVLDFRWMTEHQRRYLVSLLHEELERTSDRDRLLLFARHSLHEHRLINVHERMLRKMIAVMMMEQNGMNMSDNPRARARCCRAARGATRGRRARRRVLVENDSSIFSPGTATRTNPMPRRDSFREKRTPSIANEWDSRARCAASLRTLRVNAAACRRILGLSGPSSTPPVNTSRVRR